MAIWMTHHDIEHTWHEEPYGAPLDPDLAQEQRGEENYTISPAVREALGRLGLELDTNNEKEDA